MKRRQIIFTPDAAADLDAIYDTVADANSPALAAQYEQRIREFCEGLAYGAERGSLRGNIRPDLRVIGFERRVSVAFVVEEDRVVVLRLFYCGRDYRLLRLDGLDFLVAGEVTPGHGGLRLGEVRFFLRRELVDRRIVAQESENHAGDLVLRMGGSVRAAVTALSSGSVMRAS